MRRRIKLSVILTSALFLLSTACHHKGADEHTRYHEDGRAKPVVAIHAILDSTNNDLNWSLSEELQYEITSVLSQKKNLFVPNLDRESQPIPTFDNPFTSSLSWVKKTYPKEEFVVLIELTDYTPYPSKGSTKVTLSSTQFHTTSANLDISLRMRIIDNRTSTPKIILQETLSDTYYLPKNILPVNYSKLSYQSEEYVASPLGLAHNQLAKEIAERVADYVVLAKSR